MLGYVLRLLFERGFDSFRAHQVFSYLTEGEISAQGLPHRAKAYWRSVVLSGQRGVNAKNSGHSAEWLIPCPQKGGGIEKDGGDQVCVGKTNAKTV